MKISKNGVIAITTVGFISFYIYMHYFTGIHRSNQACTVSHLQFYIYQKLEFSEKHGVFSKPVEDLKNLNPRVQNHMEQIARAFIPAKDLGNENSITSAFAKAVPLDGYYYIEDIFGSSASENKTAILALPATYGKTGAWALWISEGSIGKGTVYYKDLKAEYGATASHLLSYYINNTPSNPNTLVKWTDVSAP